MSSIVTFYSYKGGVGRSMALANIAYELAKRNKKILVIDWDLEAPGIERYFEKLPIKKDSDGLLQLLISFKNDLNPDYTDYLWTVTTSFEHPIYLLHSGREKDPAKYSSDLECFGWDSFFNNKGGFHLEGLRNKWLKDFDLVLIDSRTGLSDASGICSILLPDIIIPMFTANYQSLFGIRDIVNFIQSARQKLSVKRMSLTILPIPSRFGTRVEFKEAQEWLDRIADILKDCFSDWLPRWITPRYILEQIKIPQIDYFSFGEKLAVVEQGTNDPESMGFVYAKLADFLASDFSDIRTFVGVKYYDELKAAYELSKINKSKNLNAGYKYDLFICYPRSVYQWAKETLLPALTEYLNDTLGYNPHIFFDVSEVNISNNWNEVSKSALESSKVFLFIYSDKESSSDYLNKEFLFADTLQKATNTNIIFSILFNKADSGTSNLPTSLTDKQIIDLSSFTSDSLKNSRKANAQFGNIVEKLSITITNSIKSFSTIQNHLIVDEKGIQNEIESLAYSYENIRKQMQSGDSRTIVMQGIFEKMKLKATEALLILPELIISSSAGKRLAAIAILHEKPDINYIDWLAEHVGDIEKPFIGYQASVGLYIASRSLGGRHKTKIYQTLEKATQNINNYEYKDTNQLSILLSARAELNLNLKGIFICYDHSEDGHYRYLLQAWNANTDLDFRFDQRSTTNEIELNDDTSKIQSDLIARMKKSNYILVVIGEKSHASMWMNWEINMAKQPDINLKFAAVKIKPDYLNPPELPKYTSFAMEFELDSINKAIGLAKNNEAIV